VDRERRRPFIDPSSLPIIIAGIIITIGMICATAFVVVAQADKETVAFATVMLGIAATIAGNFLAHAKASEAANKAAEAAEAAATVNSGHCWPLRRPSWRRAWRQRRPSRRRPHNRRLPPVTPSRTNDQLPNKEVRMATLKLLLLVAALVLFLIAAVPIANTRINLVALGLARWVATLILP
jgi:hypothetical protein